MAALGLDEVWWLVSPGNPLKPVAGMAPLPARVRSARRMARRAPIRVTAVEQVLGTRYTVDTVRALVRKWPNRRFVWLMGADNLAQFHRWKDWRNLARTVAIAVVVSAALAWRWGRWTHWPTLALLILWPSLGGHYVDLLFLNYLRPRVPATRGVQLGMRGVVWFLGGVGLAVGMWGTAMLVGSRAMHRPARSFASRQSARPKRARTSTARSADWQRNWCARPWTKYGRCRHAGFERIAAGIPRKEMPPVSSVR